MDRNIREQIEHMSKIVLHLHLDGSLRPETVLEWIIEEGDYEALGYNSLKEMQEEDRSILLEKTQNALMVEKDCRDLNEYLQRFDLPCKMLQTKEHILQATYELFADLAKQNVIYAEIRFAPSKHLEKGLSYDEVVEAAIEGMEMAKEDYDIDGSLILCAMRGDSKENNIETVKTAKKHLGKGVSALDLAGAEALFPTDDYEDIFKAANKLGIPFTIHAGEAAGTESIKKALEFGAKRIGHGVRCLEDPNLVGELIQNEIVLEVCPTSNLQTKATGENHPIEELCKRGLYITINTDNNTVSNTNINEEYEWVIEHTDLCIADLRNMNVIAARGLFGVTPQKIAQLVERINRQNNKDDKLK